MTTAAQLIQQALADAEARRSAVNNAGGGDGWGGKIDTGLDAPTGMPSLYGLAGVDPQQVFNRASDASVALAQIKKYDPAAYIVDQYGSKVDGTGYSGGGDNTEFHIQFDPTKLPALPKSPNGGALGNFGSYGSDNLTNQSMVMDDSNYGPLTDPRNIKSNQGPDLLSILGPMLIGGLAGLAGGGPLAAMLMKAPQTIGSVEQGNYNPLVGLAGSALGIPSWATGGAMTLAQLAKGQGKP